MGVSVGDFLRKVQEIAQEYPIYRTGGTGADGTCDCVGLIMGAMYRLGHGRYDLHSSNYFARHQMDGGLCDVQSSVDCQPGMAVYKRRDAQINARYLSGGRYYTGDTQDYYHVGVVTSVSPLRITHCTSTSKHSGIVVDEKLGNWCCGGLLKGIDYGLDGAAVDAYTAADADSEQDMQAATVWSQNGGRVRIRAKPSKSCRLWWWVPYGAEVDVIATDTGSPGWWKVRHGSRTGYILTEFLSVG